MLYQRWGALGGIIKEPVRMVGNLKSGVGFNRIVSVLEFAFWLKVYVVMAQFMKIRKSLEVVLMSMRI